MLILWRKEREKQCKKSKKLVTDGAQETQDAVPSAPSRMGFLNRIH